MIRILKQDQLGEWLRAIAREQKLIAPIADEGGNTAFRETDGSEPLATVPGVSAESAKKCFYPPSEELFRYGDIGRKPFLIEKIEDIKPFVLFGIRPCDAVALEYNDRFWNSDDGDPYYRRRREAATVVALNCNEIAPECFCASISDALTDPRGMDVLVTPLKRKTLLVEALTDKGKALLQKTAGMMEKGTEEDVNARRALAQKVGEMQKRRVDKDGVVERAQSLFKNDEYWRKLTRACIGCGVCTYMCPTCTCFDVMDDSIAESGFRFRCWDTCQFRQFCQEASGHDRRPNQWERQRQRVSHKFWYSVDRFDLISCVGCGRCIRLCPVNIDICELARGETAQADDSRQD